MLWYYSAYSLATTGVEGATPFASLTLLASFTTAAFFVGGLAAHKVRLPTIRLASLVAADRSIE